MDFLTAFFTSTGALLGAPSGKRALCISADVFWPDLRKTTLGRQSPVLGGIVELRVAVVVDEPLDGRAFARDHDVGVELEMNVRDLLDRLVLKDQQLVTGSRAAISIPSSNVACSGDTHRFPNESMLSSPAHVSMLAPLR
jgi:hypothetical protein